MEKNKTKLAFIHKPIICFQDLKFLSSFNSIYPPDSYKNVKGVILRQLLSDTVPAYLMLYMRACKQPEDLADNCFQRCQDIVVDWNF